MSYLFSNRFKNHKIVYSNSDTGESGDFPESVGYCAFSITEQAGYKPPRLQVLDFLIAGERNVAASQALYYQSDIEPLFDNEGNPVLPRLLTTRDPLTAKRDIDFFAAKLDEYKSAFYKRKQDEYNRRLADDKKYREFYEAHNKVTPPET